MPPIPHFVEQIDQVQRVLAEIGAEKIPQLLVFNKIDALDADHQPLVPEDFFEIDGVQTPRILLVPRPCKAWIYCAREFLPLCLMRVKSRQMTLLMPLRPQGPSSDCAQCWGDK